MNSNYPRKEILKKSGFYIILNLKNNKKYVGVSKNLYKRFDKHKYLLSINKHPNKHLQNSYNKYGKESFQFKVLKFLNEDIIFEFEKKYISLYKIVDSKNYYNITIGGKGGTTIDSKKMSSITKKRWEDPNSKFNTNNYREKLKNRQSKRLKEIWSNEDKREELLESIRNGKEKNPDKNKDMSIYKTQKFRDKQSKLSKRRWQKSEFREKMKNRNCQKLKIEIDGEELFFNSKKEAALFLKLDSSWFCKYLKGKATINKLKNIKITELNN